MKDRSTRIFHTVAIVLMGLAAAFTLLAGAGTTCVALNPTGFGGSFSGIAPYQWLYLSFVVVTLAFGVMGGRALSLLLRERTNAFRYAIIALAGSSLVELIHLLVSRSLRGSSMPVDMVLAVNILTLALFLLLRYTGIWKRMSTGRHPQSNPAGTAGGIAAITVGSICLTIQYWMAPTHTIGGVNYADIWHTQFQALGWLLVVGGVLSVLWGMALFVRKSQPTKAAGVSG